MMYTVAVATITTLSGFFLGAAGMVTLYNSYRKPRLEKVAIKVIFTSLSLLLISTVVWGIVAVDVIKLAL